MCGLILTPPLWGSGEEEGRKQQMPIYILTSTEKGKGEHLPNLPRAESTSILVTTIFSNPDCRYLNTPCLSKWLPSGEGILRVEGGTYYFVYSSLLCLTCYNKRVYLCITFLKPNSTHSHTRESSL